MILVIKRLSNRFAKALSGKTALPLLELPLMAKSCYYFFTVIDDKMCWLHIHHNEFVPAARLQIKTHIPMEFEDALVNL